MGITRNSMENYLESVNADENGKLDEYIDRIESIEVKKNGPGAASVEGGIEVTLKGSERVSSYRIYGVETNWYGYGGTGTEDTSESRRYEITIQLAQKNDGWKITSIDSSYETVERHDRTTGIVRRGKMEREMELEKNIAVKIEHVSKWFGKRKVVDDLSLETYEGEVFGFLGPNGAGKTTTIKMAVGLIGIDEGHILRSAVRMWKRNLKKPWQMWGELLKIRKCINI